MVQVREESIEHVLPIDLDGCNPDVHEVHVRGTVRRRERGSEYVRSEPGKLRHGCQAHGKPFQDRTLGLIRYASAKQRFLEQAAGDPFRVEFEVLNQFSAFRSREQVRRIHRSRRKALLKVFEDHLRFRQRAMVGLDKWNLAERRGRSKRLAFPWIDQPLPKRDFLLEEEQLELVVVGADAKSA